MNNSNNSLNFDRSFIEDGVESIGDYFGDGLCIVSQHAVVVCNKRLLKRLPRVGEGIHIYGERRHLQDGGQLKGLFFSGEPMFYFSSVSEAAVANSGHIRPVI